MAGDTELARQLAATLREIEWSASVPASADAGEPDCCPMCGALKPGPHEQGCGIAKALAAYDAVHRPVGFCWIETVPQVVTIIEPDGTARFEGFGCASYSYPTTLRLPVDGSENKPRIE